MTSKERILSCAVDLLKGAPQGMRYSDLVSHIQSKLPDIPKNTIHGNIWNLESNLPHDVYKPAKGVFLHAKYHKTAPPQDAGLEPPGIEKITEQQFYAPFRDWLIHELEECTKAISVGGNKFKDKWGTPDVIGIRESKKSDIVKFDTEIVSAEIKVVSTGLIEGFGQACSYRLFSHKSYIVVPRSSTGDDLTRLDALGRIFGIGLILFDSTSAKNPQFDIRVRAAKQEPDMFYVNRFMRYIEDELFS